MFPNGQNEPRMVRCATWTVQEVFLITLPLPPVMWGDPDVRGARPRRYVRVFTCACTENYSFAVHHGARQHTERIQIWLLDGEARGRARARGGGTHVPDAKRCCHTVWDQSQYYLRSDQGGEYVVRAVHTQEQCLPSFLICDRCSKPLPFRSKLSTVITICLEHWTVQLTFGQFASSLEIAT